MPPHTGEVHSGGTGKHGAGQKVFCPGAEAEQPKHEGIVWSLHGEYCCVEGKKSEGMWRKTNHQNHIFCVCGLSRLMLANDSVKYACTVCVDVFFGGRGKRGSQTGQFTAESDGELHRKSLPLWSSLL